MITTVSRLCTVGFRPILLIFHFLDFWPLWESFKAYINVPINFEDIKKILRPKINLESLGFEPSINLELF